ncbi:MAG: D-alanyl-D-alanine carboxypeptidase/D-alanyl-D-alanine-endopeptidase, partial [Terriglobia bacterium]
RTAGLLLKAALSQRGILVKGEVKLKVREAIETLEGREPSPLPESLGDLSVSKDPPVASIQGLPIVESLKIMMKESQNLYAECLLRLLGARTSGEGSIETGLAALAKFMAKTGTPENNLKINDASGISRKNLVTPDSLVKVLVYMDHHPLREKFLDMFPVAGKDGSLRTRFQSTPAAGHIQAKTGTMEGISTLSGYATTRQGSRLAFSLMMNNGVGAQQDVRDALDQICVWIVDWSPKPQATPKPIGQAQ